MANKTIFTSEGVMGGAGITRTAYNPTTNETKRIDYDPYRGLPQGFYNLGYKKVAEAFTKVKPKERPQLWLALRDKTHYGIDLSMLKSSTRCKLQRIGIKQLGKRLLGTNESLLQSFINKNKSC